MGYLHLTLNPDLEGELLTLIAVVVFFGAVPFAIASVWGTLEGVVYGGVTVIGLVTFVTDEMKEMQKDNIRGE